MTVFWSPRSDNLKCVLRDHNSRHFPFWSFSAYCFIISTWKKSLERLGFWGVWIFLFVCLFWSAYDLTRKRNLYFVTNSRHLILCYKLTLLQNRMIPVSWFFRKSFKELTRVPLARQLLSSPTGWLPTKASRQKAKEKGHLRAACQVEVRKATHQPRELDVMLGRECDSFQEIWGINWPNLDFGVIWIFK